MPDRTIAIGDIHGCSAALEGLLSLVQPGPSDTIVTLGDYVNRGPDTRGVLDRLIALEAQGRLVPLLGNHDQMLLEARNGLHPTTWLDMGGQTTLDSYGPGATLSSIPEAHFAFLRRCRDYDETASHIFIHAGYVPELPMPEQPPWALRWESLRDTIPGPHVSGKTIVVGHTSQKSGEILDLGYLLCIDTFCHGGGWLTALDVDTRRIWQVDRDGRPRRV